MTMLVRIIRIIVLRLKIKTGFFQSKIPEKSHKMAKINKILLLYRKYGKKFTNN